MLTAAAPSFSLFPPLSCFLLPPPSSSPPTPLLPLPLPLPFFSGLLHHVSRAVLLCFGTNHWHSFPAKQIKSDLLLNGPGFAGKIMSECFRGLIIYLFGGMQVYRERETIWLFQKWIPGRAISIQTEGTWRSSFPQRYREVLLFQMN